MKQLARPLILACAAALTALPALADLPQRKGYIPATEQHQAIIDCQYERGLRGAPKIQATYVAYPWGEDSVLRILPHGSVGAADAAWINACADARLGRASAPVQVRRVRKSKGVCPSYASVLYGGTAYCVGK